MQRGGLLTGIRLWGVRRIQVATIGRVLVGVALLVALLMWHWIAGAVTIGAVGIVHSRSRLLHPAQAPRPSGRGWFFAGELLAYAGLGVVGHPRQRDVIEQLASAYDKGETVELLVWVTTADRTEQTWTLIQDKFTASTVTASAVGQVSGACDPYFEAEQLVMSEIGVALHDVTVIGWGLDWSLDRTRDVIVATGHTDVPAGSFTPIGKESSWHLVELHPESVARSLTRVEPDKWQASAVFGLVTCLEQAYPKARALVEELVTEQWKMRTMFARLGRITRSPSVRAPELVVDPVVMSVEHGMVRERRQSRPRTRPNRVLSWERTSRRTPTRYG